MTNYSTRKSGAIEKKIAGWRYLSLEAEVLEKKEKYEKMGIDQGRYAEEGIFGLTFGISMNLGTIASCYAVKPELRYKVDSILREMTKLYGLDAKLTYEVLHNIRGRSDYLRTVQDHVITIFLSIVQGNIDRAKVLHEELTNWWAEDPEERKFAHDDMERLLNLVRMAWLDENDVQIEIPVGDYGLYSALVAKSNVEVITVDDFAPIVEARLERSGLAYLQKVEADYSIYHVVTGALFPLEAIALAKVLEAMGRFQAHKPWPDVYAQLLWESDPANETHEPFYTKLEDFVATLQGAKEHRVGDE